LEELWKRIYPQKQVRPFGKSVSDKVARLMMPTAHRSMTDREFAYDLITRLRPNEMARVHHLGDMREVAKTMAAFDLLEAAVKP
jgi:hypothetical protein